MAAVSEYFRALFYQQQHPKCDATLRTIQTGDVSDDVLTSMLEFVYCRSTEAPRKHFKSLVFQADGWQMRGLVQACAKMVLGDKDLAASLLQDGVHLPQDLAIAVAYSVPEVVPEDDAEAFRAFVSIPAIASHLACDLGCVEIACEELAVSFDEQFMFLHGCRAMYGKGLGKGDQHQCAMIALAAQLERFIMGDAFVPFLRSQNARQLPAWSVVMIVESFFVQLSVWNPEHPVDQKAKGMGKRGKQIVPEGWLPEAWSTTREDIVLWLLNWAEAQPHQEVRPATDDQCFSAPLKHLVQVRSLVRHERGASNGAKTWKEFWPSLFLSAVEIGVSDVFKLVQHSDQHCISVAKLSSKGRGKFSACPEFAAMSAAHQVYEAAFRAAARHLPTALAACQADETESPIHRLSCTALVRLLSSTELPEEQATLKATLRCWLLRGREATDQAHTAFRRSVELACVLGAIDTTLRNPWRTNSSPKYWRFTVPPEEALSRIVLAMEDVLAEGI
mmetsp:Transcript_89939/g.288395  ORF Transcript_89939/g.288395 Transcript_89939/m.288395 type:complete len:504 (+) Transcript_89939:680-2191(+)